jgi:hypothetical protein
VSVSRTEEILAQRIVHVFAHRIHKRGQEEILSELEASADYFPRASLWGASLRLDSHL